MSESAINTNAKSIHDRILILDAHIDIEVSFFTPEKLGVTGYEKLASLEKMEEGGLDKKGSGLDIGQMLQEKIW